MNLLNKVEHWGDVHHPKILDLIRMLLGLLMITKGWIILMKFPYMKDLIITSVDRFADPGWANLSLEYAIYSYLIGGTLIFLGLNTRAAALIELPVNIASLLFVNILEPFMNADVWITVLVILLLFQFMVIGSGPLSLDKFIAGIKFGKRRSRIRA
jgi:putative oxidoreductase